MTARCRRLSQARLSRQDVTRHRVACMKLEQRPRQSMKPKRPVMPLDVKKKRNKEGEVASES